MYVPFCTRTGRPGGSVLQVDMKRNKIKKKQDRRMRIGRKRRRRREGEPAYEKKHKQKKKTIMIKWSPLASHRLVHVSRREY